MSEGAADYNCDRLCVVAQCSDASGRQLVVPMSRRALPLYGLHATSTATASVHATSLPSTADAASPSAAASTTACIFDALEQGRFDAVRRAVAAQPECLHKVDELQRTPLAVALHRAREWDAVLTHCTRTGTGGADTFEARRRRTALVASAEWLVNQQGAPPPSRDALHTAVSCDMVRVADALVQADPTLIVERDVRRRTPLHVAMALAPRVAPTSLLHYCVLLHEDDYNSCDSDGATPLHHLVSALVRSRGALGLARAGAGRRAPLGQLACVLQHAILGGANALAVNRHGHTPLDMAIRGGLDYLALVRVADAVYRRMVVPKPPSNATMGLFDILPKDVLLRVLAFVPPRDAVQLSETSSSLRYAVSNEWLWSHLSARHTMAHARLLIRRDTTPL